MHLIFILSRSLIQVLASNFRKLLYTVMADTRQSRLLVVRPRFGLEPVRIGLIDYLASCARSSFFASLNYLRSSIEVDT